MEQVEAGITAALAAGLDFVTLSAMYRLAGLYDGWRDDQGYPEIAVLARAVESLRAVNREEDLDLLYFGGIRNGADVARVRSRWARKPHYRLRRLPRGGVGVGEQAESERLERFVRALFYGSDDARTLLRQNGCA